MFRSTTTKDDLEAADPGQPRFEGGVAFAPPQEPFRFRNSLQRLWRQMGAGTAPYDDSLGDQATTDTRSESGSVFARQRDGSEGFVDVIVVENQAPHSMWTSKGSGGPSEPTGTHQGTQTVQDCGGAGSEAGSLGCQEDKETGYGGAAGRYLRWRVWPKFKTFFALRFVDDETEHTYQRELWYSTKVVHICGACFIILIWILNVALIPHPFSLWNKVVHYALGPAFCLPLLPMAMWNFPRRNKLHYVWQIQCLLGLWVHVWGYFLDMRLCGYYTSSAMCGNRDFISTFMFASAPPAVGLFALGQSRAFALAGFVAFFIMACCTILPVHVDFIRNLINLLVFYAFLLAASFQRESLDRRLFTMRAELKIQFRAKQRAEINERKEQDSKRRFSSYIFHEVRVPLNTALLAVQNLEGANVFDRHSEQAIEYSALEGSLQMMSQVLNDVLDFNRMERGGFSSVSRPFSLHNVMNSIFGPLKLEAKSRQLQLLTELDPKIDDFAQRASSRTGKLEGPVAEGDGLVMGDEMRLRQVINNLTSNAAKFTQAGGSITVRTLLIHPNDSYASYHSAAAIPPAPNSSASTGDPHLDSSMSGSTLVSSTPPLDKPKPDQLTIPVRPPLSQGLSAHDLHVHNATIAANEAEQGRPIVVRFEVTDTGGGIRPKDMEENRLFSAYVQTEIGRSQGGKGTGLGLSLVRQIVMLSGGRLGVRSKVGEGSTFWVEMPFRVGPQTHATDVLEPHRRVSSVRDDTASYLINTGYSDKTSELRWGPPSPERQQSDLGLQQIEEGKAVELLERVSSLPSTVQQHLRQSSLQSGDYFSPSSTNTSELSTPSLSVTPSPMPSLAATPLSPPLTLVVSPPSSPTDTPMPASLLSPPTPSQPPPPSSRDVTSSSSTPKPKSQALSFPDGPLRVLVVDDDALTRRLMSRLMTRLGCIVSTAENGLLGLEAIVERREEEDGMSRNFDLVLLDNNMPVMSGLGVVIRLRKMGRTDLVVGVTANALISDQEEYIEKGASYVLTKPVLEADLRRFCVVADTKRRAENGAPTATVTPTHL